MIMQAMPCNVEADIVCDVLIIGAGPVGLVTANLLGLQGVRTIVLERNAALYDTPRAILIDDESFRTLQAAGLDHDFAPFVRRGQGARYYDEDGNPFVSVGPGPQDLGFPKRQHFLQPGVYPNSLKCLVSTGIPRHPRRRPYSCHVVPPLANGGWGPPMCR